jgi:uncharacterized protein (DUF302 family)
MHSEPGKFVLGRQWLRLACYLVAGITLVIPAHADEPVIVAQSITGVSYDHAREALEEAIAAEGLVSPVISYFGDMLARTAEDLGHRADIYRDAHIYTFCTVAAAARLATESPARIALCPLSIAIYQLPDEEEISLAYRPTGLDSIGGEMATATQARIVARTLAILGME